MWSSTFFIEFWKDIITFIDKLTSPDPVVRRSPPQPKPDLKSLKSAPVPKSHEAGPSKIPISKQEVKPAIIKTEVKPLDIKKENKLSHIKKENIKVEQNVLISKVKDEKPKLNFEKVKSEEDSQDSVEPSSDIDVSFDWKKEIKVPTQITF